MLARTFLSPADLKISDVEHTALVRVLNALERGELHHVPGKISEAKIASELVPLKGFNMINVVGVNNCGTYGCLLGWARYLSGNNRLFQGRPDPDYLGDLFAMNFNPDAPNSFRGKMMEDITPDDAAQALRNFLTTGKPCWREIFANEKEG